MMQSQSSPNPATPASSDPFARRKKALAERARDEEHARQVVLRRLSWAAPGGLTEADVARRAEMGVVGTGAILRQLADRAQAHVRAGVWYAGRAPAELEVPAAEASAAVDSCDPGTRVRIAREALGWSQMELARRLTRYLPDRKINSIGASISTFERGRDRGTDELREALDLVLFEGAAGLVPEPTDGEPTIQARVTADLAAHPGTSSPEIASRIDLDQRVVTAALTRLRIAGRAEWVGGNRQDARWSLTSCSPPLSLVEVSVAAEPEEVEDAGAGRDLESAPGGGDPSDGGSGRAGGGVDEGVHRGDGARDPAADPVDTDATPGARAVEPGPPTPAPGEDVACSGTNRHPESDPPEPYVPFDPPMDDEALAGGDTFAGSWSLPRVTPSGPPEVQWVSAEDRAEWIEVPIVDPIPSSPVPRSAYGEIAALRTELVETADALIGSRRREELAQLTIDDLQAQLAEMVGKRNALFSRNQELERERREAIEERDEALADFRDLEDDLEERDAQLSRVVETLDAIGIPERTALDHRLGILEGVTTPSPLVAVRRTVES